MKLFTHFPNHGDENGKNCYTISYGKTDGNEIIVGAENTLSDANEAVRRLNKIIKQIAIDEHLHDIYGLESNLLDVLHSKEEKAYAKCEIKNHKTRIAEIKKL